MARLRHPNVLQFYGLCMLPAAIVMEYCPKGSLFDVLREGKQSPAMAQSLTLTRRLGMVRARSACSGRCPGPVSQQLPACVDLYCNSRTQGMPTGSGTVCQRQPNALPRFPSPGG